MDTAINHDAFLNPVRDRALRQQLVSRRQRLAAALPAAPDTPRLVGLLQEVDAALERMNAGTFGICETCHDTIESDRLLQNPLCRNCLDHLSPSEQRALEMDLDLAFQVQRGLLPDAAMTIDGWRMAYAYEPAGTVSGDYCDLIDLGQGTGLFLLGDVSGKGLAASLLMSHLHAIFRSLASANQGVTELMAKANRVFCQGTFSSRFATLVCGRADRAGHVEVANAGHCLPLHVSQSGVTRLESTSLPLGLFADGEYQSERTELAPGDSLVLYSDGLTETFNPSGQQYGAQRLEDLLRGRHALAPKEILAAVQEDVAHFRSNAPRTDDLTVMVLQRG